MAVTPVSHIEPRCYTHCLAVLLVCRASPFLRGKMKAARPSTQSNTAGKRRVQIQPHAGGSASKHQSPPHTVGHLGTRQTYKCLTTMCQQGADSVSEREHTVPSQDGGHRFKYGLSQGQLCPWQSRAEAKWTWSDPKPNSNSGCIYAVGCPCPVTVSRSLACLATLGAGLPLQAAYSTCTEGSIHSEGLGQRAGNRARALERILGNITRHRGMAGAEEDRS